MTDRADVVVVGGGPAGSWAARSAAQAGASVMVFEKDREIGLPVRCAEGVSSRGLEGLVTVRPSWIAREVRGAKLVAPDGTVVTACPGDTGTVLHRKVFDADLAAMAAEAGAVFLTKACVTGLLRENGAVSGVRVEHLGRIFDVAAKIVIGADGVESAVGRWAGLDTRTPPEFIASCAQATVAGLDPDPELAEFHFGSAVAPGGYAWVFPKGGRTANVGLGVPEAACRVRKPVDLLKDFLERRCPGASVLTWIAGGVPLCPPRGDIVADGLILVGDAAHQASPLTGGGILNALIAGRLAGETAAGCVRRGDVSKKALGAYVKAWMKAEGENIERDFRIKKVVYGLSDEELNGVARTLSAIPEEKRTAAEIFKAGLFKHPKLAFEMFRSFF
ncbi:NAD(P)/FAD-dependent oxidoreductase [bacterium]|nr:NAD(P)/FAD-dependent oxidoreductase [bacterium]